MEWLFKFEGLSKRSEYWAIVVVLFFVGLFVGIGIFGPLLMVDPTGIISILLILAFIVATTWVTLAATARRCRDADISPYWCLIMLVPYISLIATVVFGCIPSVETNQE
jgi:uncharacterized membrane protein YhaH (DUF805 family)